MTITNVWRDDPSILGGTQIVQGNLLYKSCDRRVTSGRCVEPRKWDPREQRTKESKGRGWLKGSMDTRLWVQYCSLSN